MHPPIRRPITSATVLALALGLGLATGACASSGASDNAGASSSTSTTGAATATTAASPTTIKASPSSSTAQVSANDATVAELTAAFDEAGISNAARWAKEVDEYRPYSASDPTFSRLRQELAKYNPAAAVVDAIVATLEL